MPALFLGAGFFLIAESLTFTILALRSNSYFRVDFLDFAFVFVGAVLVTAVGASEARRLQSRPASVASACVIGVLVGIASGFLAIWFSSLGR